MWNNNFDDDNDEDESWEVRAFKEDTTRLNLLGCIWPPPSYTCTFSWKEFRSAQALGGHMNVHRRDRARLHVSKVTIPLSNPNLNTGNGLCVIYTVSNPSDKTLIRPTCTGAMEQFHGIDINDCVNYEISGNEPCLEELDLELRLGPKSSPSPMRREAHV